MSREKAKEILDDNMSECTSHHVQKMDHLEQWIIDAMIEYAHSQAKNNEVLDLVSGCFPTDEEIEKFGDIFCEEENFKPNTTFSFKDGMKKCIDIIKKNINNR